MDLAARTAPVLVFLVAITVVADIADRAGMFRVIAHQAARWARGRVALLWLLLAILAALAAVLLSLDTAAVLVTPVVIAVARRLRVRPAAFAWTTVWLANTGSLLLPVSNLTNLIALGRLRLDVLAYLRLAWAPALTVVLVTLGVAWLSFRGSLRGAGELEPERAEPVPSEGLLRVCLVVSVLLVPALAAGLDVALVAGAAALVLVLAALLLAPDILSPRMVPWPMVLGAAALFAVVGGLHALGALDWLVGLAGDGTSLPALLRLAATGALAANVVNNLPAYLALEPAATGPVRTIALLIGVNVGPVITPWGSLATLLWARRARAGGVSVSWPRYAVRGLLLAIIAVPAGVTAAWLASRL